ncbi:MAG: FG-GAP repeat protein [Euryarchaeota archaeon]|nr:FG-GAP repeat protein [Euryarchaeota archaeon]
MVVLLVSSLILVPYPTDAAFGNGDGAFVGSFSFGNAHGHFVGLLAGGQAGRQVAGAGDVNGDGFDDLLIGAPFAAGPSGQYQAGAVYLVYGPHLGSLDLGAADWELRGTNRVGQLGAALAGLGDRDGDGYDDFAVGAPGDGLEHGTVRVYRGGATGPSLMMSLGGDQGTRFGTSIAGGGDLDGDGRPDFAIGAPHENDLAGRVYVYQSQASDVVLAGESRGHKFGTVVTIPGDVNGDGRDDLAMSAPLFPNGSGSERGIVYLRYGPVTSGHMGSTANGIYYPEFTPSDGLFGLALGGTDLDGDGRAEIVVGVPGHDEGTSADRGAVYLFRGANTQFAENAYVRIHGTQAGMMVGRAVTGLGDIDRDGPEEFALGHLDPGGGRGVMRVYYGGGAVGERHLTTSEATVFGYSPGDVGVALAQAGDVNGDGTPDILAGDARRNNGKGQAYLVLGCAPGVDLDGDRLTDCREVNVLGTDAIDIDTDDDGLEDGDEVEIHLTDPRDPDTDGEGISDSDEVNVHLTDPLLADTDRDGFTDHEEIVVHGTDPLVFDMDGDGLGDGDEHHLTETDPLDPDTDGDGIVDGDEDFDGDGLTNAAELNRHGTDVRKADTDGDGLLDGEEILLYGSSPFIVDSDGDGIPDGPEIFAYGTDPLKKDTDFDGLTDQAEVFVHDTDPTKADTDGDGIKDGLEFLLWKTDPKDPDMDRDGLNDRLEIYVYKTDVRDPDSDRDRLLDGEEVLVYGTQPLDPDTDGDLYGDAYEVDRGSDPNNPLSTPVPVLGNLGPMPRVWREMPVTDILPPVLK